MTFELPLDAEDLVPHRLPMRVVDRLVNIDGKNGVVEACVSTDNPFADETGSLEDVILVEVIAQSYAALKGYLDKLENKTPQQGFLVGVKKLRKEASVRAGMMLRVEVQTLAELGDFAVAEGQIWCDEKMIACGEVKVWIT